MDGIHIMYECFHRLVHTPYRLVDGMLFHALSAFEAIERTLQIVINRSVVKLTKVLAAERLKSLDFFDI